MRTSPGGRNGAAPQLTEPGGRGRAGNLMPVRDRHAERDQYGIRVWTLRVPSAGSATGTRTSLSLPLIAQNAANEETPGFCCAPAPPVDSHLTSTR